ncbi:MAG: ATP-binding protein [Polyangiaceae bacterium]|nr:ATP-binding protein [Polyangiaceae bacterium]
MNAGANSPAVERLMKSQVGNWVSGDDFWGRDHELRELRLQLDAGNHVLLVAPRRVGKTSLMRELARRLPDNYLCLFVDLEGSQNAADAIAELALATRQHQPLWKRAQSVFQGFLENVDSLQAFELSIKLRDAVASGWRAKGVQLLQSLSTHDGPVIIFLDELPILVNRMLKGDDYKITPERRRDADLFLSFLREETSRRKGQIRFVAAGSIGLEPVLRQAALSATMNTFTPFELSPWDTDTAVEFLTRIAESQKLILQRGTAQTMVALLGSAVPHHVQLFFDFASQDARRRKSGELTDGDVQRVFEERMLSSRGHVQLSHLEERLKLVLGPEKQSLAIDLLTDASINGALTNERAFAITRDFMSSGEMEGRPEDFLREILGIFEHDGYLESKGDGYVFVSNLVRRWWRAKFNFLAKSGAPQ